MKRYISIMAVAGMLLLHSCFEDSQIILPDNFSYIAFESKTINILEGSVPSIDVKVVYSGPMRNSNIPFTISIVASGGKPAVEGVDFSIEGGLSGTISAGQFISAIKVNILNNTEAVGARSFGLKMDGVSGLRLGAPDSDESNTIAITILEDDLNVFGFTSFEEPYAGDGNVYNFIVGTDQPNNPGENSVDYISTGGELGFDTSYLPGEEGGADDVLWGVTKFPSGSNYNAGAFPNGSQAYITSDADGLAEIVFDEVTLPADASFLQISIRTWFVDGGSWEEDDEFDLFWRTDEGDELILSLKSDGSNMTDSDDGSGNNIGGKWTLFSTLVENIKSGRLVIHIGSDSGSEVGLFDDIKIQGF